MIDRALLALFPDDEALHRWLPLARDRIAFQGLPARICWLGLGQRARAGRLFNDLVASGEVSAPIVIGRDHLDCGSVASPNRETEAMRDGSDAVSDWPILNALISTASGASWVSFHHGGGVGIGYSQHAGQVTVADGTPDAAERIERVLTNDPALGVLRHADAGYADAIACAAEHGLTIPLPARDPRDDDLHPAHAPRRVAADQTWAVRRDHPADREPASRARGRDRAARACPTIPACA